MMNNFYTTSLDIKKYNIDFFLKINLIISFIYINENLLTVLIKICRW